MPIDYEARALRHAAILEVVSRETPVCSQGELVRLLAEKGIHATQSSVSRDLKELKVVRVNGAYTAGMWDPLQETMEFYRLAGFVRRAIAVGPNLAVVKTRPGAGLLVARAIDEEDWPEVAATIHGESAVLVATANHGQETFLQRIDSLNRSFLQR